MVYLLVVRIDIFLFNLSNDFNLCFKLFFSLFSASASSSNASPFSCSRDFPLVSGKRNVKMRPKNMNAEKILIINGIPWSLPPKSLSWKNPTKS